MGPCKYCGSSDMNPAKDNEPAWCAKCGAVAIALRFPRLDPADALELALNQRLADAMQRQADAMFALEESMILCGDSSVPTPQGIIHADDGRVSFERFTDRARKAMQLANQVAQKHDNEWVGTEHLLLGILGEGGGIAVHALKTLVNPAEVIMAVPLVSGAAHVPMGRLPRTERCNQVLLAAMTTASEMRHSYVGTEHLLLGLARVEGGPAHEVLASFGLTFDKLRSAVVNIVAVDQKADDPDDDSDDTDTPVIVEE